MGRYHHTMRINITIPGELLRKLDAVAIHSRISRSAAIRQIIVHYVWEIEQETGEPITAIIGRQ